MTDLIPVSVDGAVVANVVNRCSGKGAFCDPCLRVVITFHNWLREVNLQYAIVDFMDEKHVCQVFLEELLLLQKRLQKPFLFSGLMRKPREVLRRFDCGQMFPTFVTPEDAVRALRIQHPHATETGHLDFITYGKPLSLTWPLDSEDNRIIRMPSVSTSSGVPSGVGLQTH